MDKKVVIIPTYNEKENIEAIIRAVLALEEQHRFDVLVIADNKVVKKVFLEQMQIIAQSGWQPVFYTAYCMIFIPFQTICVDDFCQNAMVLFIRFMMGKYF